MFLCFRHEIFYEATNDPIKNLIKQTEANKTNAKLTFFAFNKKTRADRQISEIFCLIEYVAKQWDENNNVTVNTAGFIPTDHGKHNLFRHSPTVNLNANAEATESNNKVTKQNNIANSIPATDHKSNQTEDSVDRITATEELYLNDRRARFILPRMDKGKGL